MSDNLNLAAIDLSAFSHVRICIAVKAWALVKFSFEPAYRTDKRSESPAKPEAWLVSRHRVELFF